MAVGDKITGTLGSAARGVTYQPFSLRLFNISIWGTFSATVVIVRSFDQGTTWIPIAKPDLSGVASFTVPISIEAVEGDATAIWAVSTLVADGGAYTSGTVNYAVY